jgi:LytS/YehU family sensor histidine kinase
LILAEIVIYVLCRYLIVLLFHFLHLPLFPPFKTFKLFVGTSVFRGIYFIGLSTGYWFSLSTLINRKKITDLENAQLMNQLQNEALEKALLTSENAYLRSQINPHFLLNTLNFLYNSVSKFSEQLADSVMTLADIMRYALTNAGEDGKVLLEAEIEQISNFIKLNQARFNQRLNIDLRVEGDAEGLRIIPLVLITLAENVFKYGDLLNEENPAAIAINIDGNNLTFTTKNLKKKKMNEQSHGIGINNVKSRLAMYHQYELAIEDNENDYKSTLKIKL